MSKTLVLAAFACMAVMVTYSVPASIPVPHRAKRWEEFPNVTLTFDCSELPMGFYADEEFGCMLFHFCDEEGVRIPHMCGNGTGFNQEFRICDFLYNFDCAQSKKWYYLNELTYAVDNKEA
ncbi:hypothetical protein FNE60_30125 [Klebsiella pneumoniae]|nr:hypothetical protein FNE65_30320 [Klebsiella pneumoniae]KAB1724837.1 hypothetical protein FNE60_30125 [Klebsiella pneumoniae]